MSSPWKRWQVLDGLILGFFAFLSFTAYNHSDWEQLWLVGAGASGYLFRSLIHWTIPQRWVWYVVLDDGPVSDGKVYANFNQAVAAVAECVRHAEGDSARIEILNLGE